MSAGPRQLSPGYYITVGNCLGKIYAYNTTAGVPTFSPTSWASTTLSVTQSWQSTTMALVSSAGSGILRDMGKTVVSANRTFRKVQLVVSSPVTFGVGGPAPTTGEDYLSGYIELAIGNGLPGAAASNGVAPVAFYGR